MKLSVFELKRLFKSLIFCITVVILILSISMQIGENYKIEPPQPGNESYGYKIVDDLELIYPNLLVDLYQSVENNSFTTYPYGFYKNKILDSKELDLMKEFISELAGTEYHEILTEGINNIPTKDSLENSLEKINSLLEGGSDYAPDAYLFKFGNIGMDYNEALEEYNLMKTNGLDVAFTRYFSDYAGIFISLITWFLPLSVWLKDGKSGIINTIFVKSTGTIKLFLSRICAITVSILLVLILFYSYYEFKIVGTYGIENTNILKAYGLLIIWLIPNVLFCVSMSSLITIVTNNVITAIVGPLGTFITLLMSPKGIYGNYGWQLVLRHNTIGNEQYFLDHFNQLLLNRSVWLLIGVFICVLSIIALNKKREGYYAIKTSVSHKSRVKA
ncbi:hypothetical protein DES36_1289 [Alkalibaculum bacchi]|uniref:ABC-2 family transporter n=3 Tax=Alkalibaculum bacchi TaxID=645887 RepID=A0A366HYL1_9FIRM|nr:hypothetical protein DES36_1289 [Alkalibaculum bacchi]